MTQTEAILLLEGLKDPSFYSLPWFNYGIFTLFVGAFLYLAYRALRKLVKAYLKHRLIQREQVVKKVTANQGVLARMYRLRIAFQAYRQNKSDPDSGARFCRAAAQLLREMVDSSDDIPRASSWLDVLEPNESGDLHQQAYQVFFLAPYRRTISKDEVELAYSLARNWLKPSRHMTPS